jgi:hypothetical protein
MQDIKAGSFGSRKVWGISLNEGSEILTLPLVGTFSVLEESCASVSTVSDTGRREPPSSDIGVGGTEPPSWDSAGGSLRSSLTFLASGTATSASSASLFLNERKKHSVEKTTLERTLTHQHDYFVVAFFRAQRQKIHPYPEDVDICACLQNLSVRGRNWHEVKPTSAATAENPR